MHDTFLTALRRLDQVREPVAVGGWLHRILRNVCLMRLRSGRGEMPFDELPTGRKPPDPYVEESFDRLALREWVWAELPEALRVTVMLRYFGSFASYAEISAILGVPVGAVKSRPSQAKIKLAGALLEATKLEHAEAHRPSESRARFFDAAHKKYNRGEGYETLLGAFSEDLVMDFSDGTTIHEGYEFMAGGLEQDLETGLKMYPTNVVASRDVTIIECDIENSSDYPFHCPPTISQVAIHRNGGISRMRWRLTPEGSRMLGSNRPRTFECGRSLSHGHRRIPRDVQGGAQGRQPRDRRAPLRPRRGQLFVPKLCRRRPGGGGDRSSLHLPDTGA
ncbi:hypothetical protein BH18ACT10_BH18ACT10_05630 [soil metagenome]